MAENLGTWHVCTRWLPKLLWFIHVDSLYFAGSCGRTVVFSDHGTSRRLIPTIWCSQMQSVSQYSCSKVRQKHVVKTNRHPFLCWFWIPNQEPQPWTFARPSNLAARRPLGQDEFAPRCPCYSIREVATNSSKFQFFWSKSLHGLVSSWTVLLNSRANSPLGRQLWFCRWPPA